MITRTRWALLLALALTAGCMPTLNALYTEESLIFDPAFIGRWSQDGSKARWEFTQRDESSYHLTVVDESSQHGRFIVHLVKLNDELFLDLYPDEMESDVSGLYQFHLVPIHTVYRVRRTAPTLQLALIDFQWLEKRLDAHPDEIEHASFAGRKLITAPTRKVQEFVLAHKDAFTATVELVRQPADGA